jgi:hypothetical protein
MVNCQSKIIDAAPLICHKTINTLTPCLFLDLFRKIQVGQAFSLTPFENMDFGGLEARPTYARDLIKY